MIYIAVNDYAIIKRIYSRSYNESGSEQCKFNLYKNLQKRKISKIMILNVIVELEVTSYSQMFI